MEKLTNKDKKELFMSMVEKAKNGTLDMMHMTDSKKYDENYSQLRNNHGSFGIVIDGITKDGKISVYLAESLEKQLPSEMGGAQGYGVLQFNDTELNDFLDRFFEMNNMEILNEFYKNAPEYFKNISLEEYKNDDSDRYYNRLATLNALDYLSAQGSGNVNINGRNNFVFENGLNVFLDEENGQITIYKDDKDVSFNIKNDNGQEVESPELDQYLKIISKSIGDLPNVYESIMNGRYQKEDFVSSKENENGYEINEYGEIIRPNNKTPLQQKEDELSSLEEEEKTISEAEALIKKEMDKKGKDIGE